MRANFSYLLALSLAALPNAARTEVVRCGGETVSTPTAVVDQLAKIDNMTNSLRELESRAETSRAEMENMISAGSTDPVLYEQLHVLEVREKDIARQITEFEDLRSKLCHAAHAADN
jgi:hypothetical protein